VTAQAPVVYPLKPCSCAEDNVTVACLVDHFFPEPVDVSWASPSPYESFVYPASLDADGFYHLGTSLTTTTANLNDNSVSCTVRHETTDTTITKDFSAINTCCFFHPDSTTVIVELFPPSLEELFITQNASVTCVATNVRTPGDVHFSWKREKGVALDVAPGEPVQQRNGLYRLSSVLRICAEEWNSDETFTCTVSGPELPEAITKSIKKDTEGPVQAPQVFVFPPPAEELAREETATLTCLATNFRPKDILVTWTQQDQPVPSGSYQVFGPKEDAEGYTVYSLLRTSAAAWQRGDSFACVVAHEGLPLNFVHKSLDKSSGKPTAVNVSVVLADADVTCY
ncbi:IGHA2 protein, partial [Nothocercus nigrocapillus]|nr:IGHA2 protein [Nothocercus nigrocapillus]